MKNLAIRFSGVSRGKHKGGPAYYLDTAASVMLKLMLFVALFCPISTTMEGNKHPQYYQEFLLVNAAAVIFMMVYVAALFYKKNWNRENLVFGVKFFFVMCLYVFFYWLMMDSIQWKWQGVNCMISFGFFLLLMCGRNREWFDRHHIIEFANRSIVLSNLIGIFVYLKGYASVYWYDFKFQLMLPQAFYREKRFEWIYYHKSQYALMLLLSLAFILVYRKKFLHKVTFAFSVAVIVAGLYISHVNTAMVGGGLILGSFCVDWFIRNFKKIRLWIRVAVIPLFGAGVVGACVVAFQKIAAERSVLTLGYRTYIWESAVNLLLKRPEGLGLRFSFKKLHLDALGGMTTTNNGHNIFLNEMLRLSIPVGICFIIFFVLIIAYALEKKFSFFTLGIWGALLMSMMMDYAVMNSGWTLMLFFFYAIFFLDVDGRKKNGGGARENVVAVTEEPCPEEPDDRTDASQQEESCPAASAVDNK